MIEIGTKVRIGFPHQPWMRRFSKKVGIVKEIRQVQPSKRVRDGLIYYVYFDMLNRQTGKRGVLKSFIRKDFKVLTTPEIHGSNIL